MSSPARQYKHQDFTPWLWFLERTRISGLWDMAHLMADSWNTGMASDGASSPVHRMSRALTPWQPSRPTTSGLLEIPIKTAILPRSLHTAMEQPRATSVLDAYQDYQLNK